MYIPDSEETTRRIPYACTTATAGLLYMKKLQQKARNERNEELYE